MAEEKPFEFVAVQPHEVVGYAAGIAIKEAIVDGALTDEQARVIVDRSIELVTAMQQGKFINPLDNGKWEISDTPDERVPETVKKAVEAQAKEAASVLEIGG